MTYTVTSYYHSGTVKRRDIAARLDRQGNSGFYETIHDVNGNDVGRWKLAEARF